MCTSKRGTRQNTHKSRGWGGNYVGAFVCVRGVLSIGRQFFNARLVDMVAIEWNVGSFAICYKLKGCKVCKLCMDEFFLHLFGIITMSTTTVKFVCLG